MAALLFYSYSKPVNWLQNNLLPCPFKKITGIDCPLCGLQRSLIALMRGDVITSFRYQPATIVLILAIVLSVPDSRLYFTNKPIVRKMVYSLAVIIIAGSYLYKISSGRL